VRRVRPWAAVTALAIAVLVGTPAQAGIDAWSTGDQPGGEISSLALDGATALGGNGSGLYRSSDGGASWTRVGAFDYRTVTAVAIDPAAGEPLYAATTTGMFRSLDQGTSWASITGAAGGNVSFTGVAVDSGAPGTALFLVGAKAYRSTTGGAGIWTNVSAGLPAGGLTGVLIDPQTHTAWGWAYEGGVFVLPGGATTWSAANSGLPSVNVQGLALDSSGTRRVIAATTSGMASLPAAGGPSWSALNTGLTGAPPYPIALGYGIDGNSYVTLLDGTLWRLAPGATTWTPLPAAGLPAGSGATLVGDQSVGGRIVALTAAAQFEPNAGLGPLWRSTDSGATFAPSAAGIDAVSVAALAPDSQVAGRILVATRQDAVQRSQDGGATWAPGATGLPDPGLNQIAADGARAGVFYAGTQSSGVYRSTDAGVTWAAVGSTDPSSPFRLVTVPGRSGVVYASAGATVYKSTDSGDTWAPLPALPGGAFSVGAIVADPADPDAVYVGDDKGVARLAAGASAWTPLSAGLEGLAVNAVAVDPRIPSTLLAGTFAGGIYRSTDSGVTWHPSSGGEPDSVIAAVAMDPQLAQTAYAASASGVVISTDGGATWAPLTGGVALPPVSSLAFSADGRTLYAGTNAIGVLARTRSLPAPPPPAATGRAPVSSGAPTISGAAKRSAALTASLGVWSGEPAPVLAPAWRRCDGHGANCAPIPGATASSYRATLADVGRTLQVAVTATNALGTATAASAVTAHISSAPVITHPPRLAGAARSGRKLKVRAATATAYPSAHWSYRWQRCPARGGKCRTLRHATKSTYRVRGADAGHRLRVIAVVRNSLGVATQASSRSAVVR
jgi:hypothetical protein